MTNAQPHLVVGEPLEAGSSVTARGAGCGFADIQNPADRPLQVRGQFLAGCEAESSPTVFAMPFEVELPPRSTMSIGLGLTCAEEAAVGLGPATEGTAESGGYVWRPIVNEGQRLAALNAFLIMTGAQTANPDQLRFASPQAVRIELPASETVRIGLQLDTPAVAGDGLIDETQIREPTPEEESDDGDVQGLDWDRSNWRALDGGDTAGDDELDRDESPRRSHEREDGDGPGDTAGMEGAEPPGTGMMFAKGRLAVAADVGLNMRAVNEPVASAGIGDPHTWIAVEPGSSTSVEIAPRIDVRFSWPDPLLPQLMSMPNIWYTTTIPYEPRTIRRSSSAGFDAGPYAAATGSPESRGRSIVPIGAAIVVIALIVAGGLFALLSGGGDGGAPASSEGTAASAASTSEVNSSEATSSPAASPAGEAGDNGAAASDTGSPAAQLGAFFEENGSPVQQAFAVTYVDGRPNSDAPPVEWLDAITMAFLVAEDGEVWLQIGGPLSLIGELCGEVDIITGRNEHAGDGIDFCAQDAIAPAYFENVVEIGLPGGIEDVSVVIRTGQIIVADDDRVSLWPIRASSPDSYQTGEFVGQVSRSGRVQLSEDFDAIPRDRVYLSYATFAEE